MSRQLLVIDNYDSFTYNLVQYLGELGASPVVHRNDAITLVEVASMSPLGVVISPGPCTPAEAGISTDLVRELGPSTPILGVCLGHQCIGEAYGGRVVRAPRVMHGKLSRIDHDGSGVFAGLPNPLTATRYHSLVVEAESVPSALEVTAWTDDDGARVVMGMQHREHPVAGVQFHPESILTDAGHELLRNFLDLCESHARVRA
jgi:anthranilate synthase component 2